MTPPPPIVIKGLFLRDPPLKSGHYEAMLDPSLEFAAINLEIRYNLNLHQELTLTYFINSETCEGAVYSKVEYFLANRILQAF